MAVRPFNVRSTALAVALAALAGCASPDVPFAARASSGTLPALTPSSSAQQRADLSIERWWQVFDDGHLNALVDGALALNADLEIALARVREAQAGIEAARARQMPTLDARIELQRAKQSAVGAQPLPPGTDRHASSHGASLLTSYELDLWGALSSQTEAARARALSSEWARAAAQWSLTAQLAESYFGLLAVDRQIDISQAVRDSRQTTLQLRQREVGAGAGNEFDLRRAEAEVTSAEATLAQLQRQRAGLERALALLTGQTPQTARRIARGTLDESQVRLALLPRDDVQQLLERRPDIRQAEASLAASHADLAAARAGAYPQIRFSGTIGHDAKALSDLFSGPSLLWSVAASATQAIFDGGRVKSQVHAEEARQQQAQASYRKAVAGAYFDLREAYEALDHTQAAYHAEGARVASLSRAREIALTGFGAGAISYLDVLDAERNLYQARLQRVDAHRDRLTAQVAIYKALGGGYATPTAVLARN